jgi:fatty acid kinase fatty acid binding subunit
VSVSIVTDSAASLPPELADRHDITVVPLSLTLGGISYHDGDLSLAELLSRLDEGVTTSAPSPGEVAKAIEERLGDDGVLVLTIAGTMSGTFHAAHVASLLVDGAVRVLDTETAAGAEGLVVLAAAVRARDGARLDEVEATAVHVRERVRLVATVDSLDHLVRSGRVPGIAGRAGRGLGLNPLFEFRRGHPRPLRPALSRQAALDRMVTALFNSRVAGARLHVAALHAGAPEPAERLLEQVRAEIDPATAFLGSFSPVMVVHTGPGLVGLAWWWDGRSPGPRS